MIVELGVFLTILLCMAQLARASSLSVVMVTRSHVVSLLRHKKDLSASHEVTG